MAWKKGKRRGWWAIKPKWLDSFSSDTSNSDLITRIARGRQRDLARLELERFIKSGEHIVTDSYFPGQRDFAEREYAKILEHRARLAAGNKAANSARSRERLSKIDWIAQKCGSILAKEQSIKAQCRDIEKLMRTSGIEPPSSPTLYRYLATLKARNRLPK